MNSIHLITLVEKKNSHHAYPDLAPKKLILGLINCFASHESYLYAFNIITSGTGPPRERYET